MEADVQLPGRKLRADEWVVRSVSLAIAQRMVRDQHYSRSCSNTATYRHGLFYKDAFWEEDCMGVAIWIPPTKSAAKSAYPKNWRGVLSLSRLVVFPEVPSNGASFLLGHSMKMIDKGRWPCLLTYADEWRGHTGAIYKATNWIYDGLTQPQAVYVKDGRMISRKAGPKTRRHDEMIKLGAEMVGRFKKHRFLYLWGKAIESG